MGIPLSKKGAIIREMINGVVITRFEALFAIAGLLAVVYLIGIFMEGNKKGKRGIEDGKRKKKI